jgi:hypothetical protein
MEGFPHTRSDTDGNVISMMGGISQLGRQIANPCLFVVFYSFCKHSEQQGNTFSNKKNIFL